MKVFVVAAALLAVAVADSAYPAGYKAPSYPAPAYKAPAYPAPEYKAPAAYPAPSYPAPAYKAASYETYAPQPYSFAYDVKDDYYNNFGHKETSDGKYVTGSYHVYLPDGRHQTVTYKADDYTGYVADVKYDGEAKYDYKPAAYKAAEYSAPAYKAPAYPTPAYPAPAYKAPAYPAKY